MGRRLSDDIRNNIREMRTEGKTYKEISEVLGVSEASVSYVVRGIDTNDREKFARHVRNKPKVFSSDTDFLAEAIVRLNNRVDRLERIVNSK